MRALSFVVSVLLAGSAYAQAPASVYTPAQRDAAGPTYINATVVRVDPRHDTITFRSESGEVSLTVEGDAVAGLRRLRPGDEVVLGYRVDDRTGRPTQIVTAILAGEEMAQRGLVATSTPAAMPSSLSSLSGRVVRVDPTTGTLTVVDAEGRTESLSVQGAAALGTLSAVLPGDQVDVSFVPGSAAFAGGGVVGGVPVVGGVFGTVNAIQPVATPTFVTGRVTGIDSNTGALTLRTGFGEQVFMLPPSGSGRMTVGQDVRLDLNGNASSRSFTGFTPLTTTGATATTGVRTGTDTNRMTRTGTFATPITSGQRSLTTANRTGAAQATNTPRTGTTTHTLGTSGVSTTQSSGRGTVTNFGSEQAGTRSVATSPGTTTSAATPAGRTPVATTGGVNTGSVRSGGAVGSTGRTSGTPTTTATVAGTVPSVATIPGTTGSANSPNAGVGTMAAAGPATTGVGTTTTNTLAATANANGVAGQTGTGTVSSPGVNAGIGDVANTGTFTTGGSPLGSQIPSLPSVVGQLNVVPPPTAAPALPETMPVGAARDLATKDYDAGVRAMAMKANEIDAHWFRYRDGCLRNGAVNAEIDRGLYTQNRDRQWFLLFTGEVGTPVDDNCRQLMVEMTRMSNDWKDTMTRLEDTARKNDVLPGAMRESRQRYRVEF